MWLLRCSLYCFLFIYFIYFLFQNSPVYFSCKAFPHPINHGKSKDGIQPFKGLKPAARTANSPENRAYRAACRGWHIPPLLSTRNQNKQGTWRTTGMGGCWLDKVGGRGRAVMNNSLRERGEGVVPDLSPGGARGTAAAC